MTTGFLNAVSPQSIIMVALLAVMIVVMLIVPIITNKRRAKNATRSNAGKQAKKTDELDALETSFLVEKAMTSDEKKAYDYFTKTDDGKGGCLHKGGDTVSDDEYDRIVTDKLNEFGNKARALARVGMDADQVNEIEPIRFFGYEKRKKRLNDNYASKIGDDGRWRSSVVSVTWLFFSDGQICIYNGRFDMFTSSRIELTDEYFYKDITNFTTVTDTDQTVVLESHQAGCLKKHTEVDATKKLTDYDTFALIVPGDSFTCSVSGVPNASKIIEGIKQKLREKKIF